MDLEDAFPYLIIGFLILGFGGIGIGVIFTHSESSTVIAISPDSQITYNTITFQSQDGIYSLSISCTGNFQFQIGQSVTVWYGYGWWNLGDSFTIQNLPAGCVKGN